MRRSASKIITSMFGFNQSKHKDEASLLKDGLKTVSRILYAAGGLHDKHLSVAYSDGGSYNQVGGSVVYLDSDVVLRPRKGFEDYDIRNDVLVGSALVGANIKLTADDRIYEFVEEEEEDKNISRVYQSTEFRASEMRVEKEAPGLTPYLDSRSDYYVDDKIIKALNTAAQEPETHSEVACALLNNALLHRNAGSVVDMSVYTESVNEAVGRLERCKDSKQRHKEAIEIVNWFREMFDPEPPPPPPNGGGDNDDQSQDDDQNQDGQGQGGQGKDDDQSQDDDQNQDGQGQSGQGQDNQGQDNDDQNQDGQGQSGQGQGGQGQGGQGKDNQNQSGQGQGGQPNDSNGQPTKPDMSGVNKKFDEELTIVSGAVNSDTGRHEVVKAISGQPGQGQSKASEPERGIEIGKDAPCNGWGDEVEPASIYVSPIAVGSKEDYDQIRSKVLVGIRALVNKLSWTSQEPDMTEHGYLSGDLDEGALSNLFLHDPLPAVFQRTETIVRPEVAVGIMVDESGSMYGEKIRAAQRVAVMLTEAFNQVSGTRVRVWGHTAGCADCQIIPYVTALHKSPHGISTMMSRGSNIDGAALWYAAQELTKFDSDAKRRILFCISDGAPSGGKEDGVKYNRRKAEAARALGVEVFGIGILNAYTPELGERLFGKDAYYIFPDVESAGQVIGAFITRVVNRL